MWLQAGKLLEENIRKVKLSTPDYRDMDPEEAVIDFKKRRQNYAKVYEPVDETDGPHVKIINSKQFVVTNIRGYLPLKVRASWRSNILSYEDFFLIKVAWTNMTCKHIIGCPLCNESAHAPTVCSPRRGFFLPVELWFMSLNNLFAQQTEHSSFRGMGSQSTTCLARSAATPDLPRPV